MELKRHGNHSMKLFVALALALALCLAAPGAHARNRPKAPTATALDRELERELQAHEQERQKRESVGAVTTAPEYKRLLISLRGGFGLAFPSGDISASGGQEALAAMGYTAGLALCWRAVSLGGPVIGAASAGKQVSTRRDYLGSNSRAPSATTVNVMAGWRFILVKMLYIETGLYYGIRAGSWTDEQSYRGKERELTVRRSWTRDDAGVSLEIGVMFDVLSFMSIDVGLKMEASFLYSYVKDDRLRTNLALLTAGVTFKML